MRTVSFLFIPYMLLRKYTTTHWQKKFFVQKYTESHKPLKQGGSNLIPSNHVTFYMQHIVRIK